MVVMKIGSVSATLFHRNGSITLVVDNTGVTVVLDLFIKMEVIRNYK